MCIFGKRKKISRRSGHGILLVVVVFSVLIFFNSDIFSKYYSVKSQKGVTMAAGYYFTSNYLAESNGGTIPEYVKDGWDGKTEVNLALQIRNFENYLLYNDINLSISYKITFNLESDPINATYYVQSGTGNYVLLSTSELTFDSEIINGGAALENVYNIKIVPTDGLTAAPVPICVKAETIAPSYISKKLTGKISLLLATSQGFIQEKGFYKPATTASALLYKIMTATEVKSLTDISNVTYKLNLKWDTSKLDINQNSQTYIELKDNPSTYYIDSNGFGHLIIDTMPYSSIQIEFFKKSDFYNNGINYAGLFSDGSSNTLVEFPELVDVSIVQ